MRNVAGGGGLQVIKQETGGGGTRGLAVQDYVVSRPMPLEAISPPATEEVNEGERMLMQVQEEIRHLNKNKEDLETGFMQLEAELRNAEARKVIAVFWTFSSFRYGRTVLQSFSSALFSINFLRLVDKTLI